MPSSARLFEIDQLKPITFDPLVGDYHSVVNQQPPMMTIELVFPVSPL
jgi:hypothetical protein